MSMENKQERRTMTAVETVKRFSFMIIGLIITALGLAICVETDLGISPITTLAYTLNHVVPAISLGTFTFFQHLVFFTLMVLLLRRDFRPYQLLQIPCSFLFGAFLDIWKALLDGRVPAVYPVQFLVLLLGCAVVAFGFSMVFTSRVALEANTAFLNALSLRTGKTYGLLKMISDIVIVVLAAVVGLIFLHKIVGIREGTVIAAVVVGPIAGFFNRRLARTERFFTAQRKEEKP